MPNQIARPASSSACQPSRHGNQSPGAWKQELIEACAGLLACAFLTFVLFAASAPGAPTLIGGH